MPSGAAPKFWRCTAQHRPELLERARAQGLLTVRDEHLLKTLAKTTRPAIMLGSSILIRPLHHGAVQPMAPIPALANCGADTIEMDSLMNLIQTLEQEEIARLNKTIPDFNPGDTVIVSVNVG